MRYSEPPGPNREVRAVQRPKNGLFVRSENGLRLRDRKVQRLVRKMQRVMPWLEDADYPACRGWAELEILSATAFADLRRNGILNKENESRRLLSDYRKLRLAQLTYERELGMTPAARIAIKAHSTQAALDLVASMGAEEAEPADSADRAGTIEKPTFVEEKPPDGSGDES